MHLSKPFVASCVQIAHHNMSTIMRVAVLFLLILPPPQSDDLPLDKVVLPDGFEINVYAKAADARQLAMSPSGTLFIGSRREGSVYAAVDRDGDMRADSVYVVADSLIMPTGIAFHEGSLYVAAVSTILRYDDIETRLEVPPEPVVVVDDLPTERHHGWKYLGFSPEGKMFVPVGTPCNTCEEPDPYATILMMNPDGSERHVFARGVRNSVGFDWHPVTGDLWFTDNGRDNISPDPAITDDLPSCELNHAPELGLHFGYPYFHQGDTPDPEFGEGRAADEFIAPVVNLGPHVAPLGMEFYTGDMFPEAYRNQAFIAEHGSWNRTEKIGYRVKLVRFNEDGMAEGQEVFAKGWLENEQSWGRPVDLLTMSDGSLLLSDDQAGVVYRITYTSSDQP